VLTRIAAGGGRPKADRKRSHAKKGARIPSIGEGPVKRRRIGGGGSGGGVMVVVVVAAAAVRRCVRTIFGRLVLVISNLRINFADLCEPVLV
jgi:hypothetical protein